MGERRAHARNLRPIRLPSTFKVDYTCQAAHFTSLKMIRTGLESPFGVGIVGSDGAKA
jgi:hypothetical protein